MTKSAKDRDRALALGKQEQANTEADGDAVMDDAEEAEKEPAGSKVIVLHVGSQNLRIGLASDALPKSVPMVIARKSPKNESEDGVEPRPKRVKLGDEEDDDVPPEKLFGPEVQDDPFVIFGRYSCILTCLDSLHRNTLQCQRNLKRGCAKTSEECFPTPKKW